MGAPQPHDENPRQAWLSLLSKAPEARLRALWDCWPGARPQFEWLRVPEVGSVMVQGRMGAVGAPFNLGEMTVTRGAIETADGVVGHGVVQGRSKEKLAIVAQIDALMLGAAESSLRAEILDVLSVEMASARAARTARAGQTKVDFFTLVRGED